METSRNINVFLVEDNLLYQRALKAHLEENIQNINIRTFNNGEEMLQHINKNPDVVVLDYMLHNSETKARNGLSILKKVIFKKPYTPVIILSGQKNKSVVNQLNDEGAYDYISKFDHGFEKVTNNILEISSELDEQRKEEKNLWNAMVWTFSIAIFLFMLLYKFNIHK